MSLLGDTPFLNQLASSTSLLTDNIAKTDTAQIKNLFGNYNPNVASDYVYGPMGGIAQNQFVGNQFQLPYQPGEFTTFGGQFGSGGFNTPYTPGGYTPGQFNQYGNVPVTGNIPSNVSTTTMQTREGGGGGQPDNQRGLESIGGMNLSINPATGRIEILEDGTLQSNLLTDIAGLQKYTPTGLLSSALGGLTNSTEYGRQLDRIESQFGKPVADEIAATVRESYGIGKAQPTGVLSAGLKPGTEVTSNGVKGFINSQGNFQRGTLIGKLDADLPGGVNYEANKRAEATQKAVDDARAKQAQQAAAQAREARNSRPSTGGASRDKQQANRDLGASRGRQTGGGQKLGR